MKEVFAGCYQPLLATGPSRHYLCNPCVGAWTLTPPCSSGANAHYFPEDTGLTSRETRSAHENIPAKRLQQGALFRGCSHPIIFKLPHSLGLRIAPTAAFYAGRLGRLHHASPRWLPYPECGIATCPTWAIGTAGLSPAGLQPCRLLHPITGEKMFFNARTVVTWKYSPVLKKAVNGVGKRS